MEREITGLGFTFNFASELKIVLTEIPGDADWLNTAVAARIIANNKNIGLRLIYKGEWL